MKLLLSTKCSSEYINYIPASVDRHKHRVDYNTPYIHRTKQTGLEMLKIAARTVSAWSAGHTLSILVKESLSISAIW